MKTGRPKKIIDWDLVKSLCEIFLTQEEISHVLKISVDTLDRASKREKKITFAEYYKQASVDGKRSLRARQFKLAMDGHAGMLIWLGKQYLGQSDKDEINFDQVKPFVLAYDPNNPKGK
jgi:hypothetical protein